MNRIYKVIYSKAHQCYVVVSELAKRNHKSSQSSIDHSTPALARIIAVTIAAGALTLGSTPGISWAADTTAENKAGTGIGIALGENSKTDEFAKNQIAIGVGAVDKSDGSAPNDAAIAIGAGAHTYNELGRRVATISFGKAQKDYTGGIAIGTKTYAITGGTSIGQRDYNGVMGDVTVSDENRDYLQYAPGATSLGSNAYAGGTLATVIGAYNISSSGYNGTGGLNSAYYVAQNLGSTILGTLNSNESASAKDTHLELGWSSTTITPSSSGIANSIVGVANTVKNSNGSIVLGAGNTVSNSSTKIVDDITGSYSELKNWQPISYKSVNDMAQDLRNKVKSSKSGGSTLVIGGGNTADYTQRTQIMGVNNTVTGTEKNISDYNLIDGYRNTVSHVKHATIIGSKNTISGEEKDNVESLVLLGDKRNIWALADNSVVIGSSDDTAHSYVTRPDEVIIGHNAYVENHGGNTSGGGDVAIGHNSFIENYVNQSGSIALGQNTHIRNSTGSTENAFILNQYETTKDGNGVTIPTDVAKMNGSIAIGENTFARTGSLMIGTHKYTGKIGDTTVDTSDAVSMAKANQQINETVLGTNSFSLGAFSTVTGAYSIISGDYDKEKWNNFGSSITGSLNSIESKTATAKNAGVASHIIGTANRMQNTNGAVVLGSGNEITDSNAEMSIPTSNNVSAKDLSEKIRTSIQKDSGGAASVVGNGNEVKKSTNIAVVGSKNSVTSTTNSQIFGDNRTVTGADGAPIDGAVIIGSAAQTNPLTTNKKNVTILGYNANATVDGGAAIGAGSVASREAGVAGYDPATKKESEETSATWKATDAAVSVGKADGTMTRQITGVAAGSAATDAVNVAQLQKALAGAKDGNDTLQADKNALKLNGNTLSMSVKDTAGNEVSGSVDLSRFAQAVDTNTTYTLSGQANQDNTTTITLKDSNGRENSVTVATKDTDTRNTVKAGENVTLDTKDNADGSHEYTVNVKADGKVEAGSTKIVSGGTVYNETRVKQDGKYVKAANTAGENLSALDSQVASNASNITNINGRVNNLDSKINKVGAGAAALAALHPLDFDPDDKWDFAVGYGNYRDANSAAVGAFYRPDEDTMFNFGTNFGNGENMINAGVSFKFGPKGKSQVRPGSTQEITELRATVARQDDQLKKQDNEIKELKAMVQQLMAKQDKQAATK